MKLPAFQFYPADWRKDPAVQSLNFHDRGVWFEMICLMHESSERGVLLLNGNPMPEDALARMLGLDKQILTTTITTLLSYGAAKRRDSDGAIYSDRMVRDEKIIQIRREAGKKGGNPALLNQNQTTKDKQIPTPSSSSSSSSSTTVIQEAISAASPATQEKRPRAQSLPDDEWVESLKATYSWLDIPTEMAKIDTWLSVNPQRQKTRRFVINWLNRIGKPMTATNTSKPNKFANAW